VLVRGSDAPVLAVCDRNGAWHDAWSGDPIPAPTHWAPMIPPLPHER
jgi:hypothetical protein